MARIFIYLSVSNILLLMGAAVIGLLDWAPAPDRHVILAVLSLLLSSFVQVLIFTYFNVTGKMVTQAIHLSAADKTPIFQQKQIKYSYMWLMAIVLGCFLFSVITGATSWRTGITGYAHLLAAGVIIAAHLFVFTKEYSLIVVNSLVVKQVLQAYEDWQKIKNLGDAEIAEKK